MMRRHPTGAHGAIARALHREHRVAGVACRRGARRARASPRAAAGGSGDTRVASETVARVRRVVASAAGERGSGGIAGVAVIGVLCALLVAIAPIGSALAARQSLQGAADAAALAAADTASGRVVGSPCEAAAMLASALDVALTACAVDARGLTTVRVSATVFGIGIDASARAGPPGVTSGLSPRLRRQPTMAST